MTAYSGTPLGRKLGISDGSLVLLIGAPADLDLELGPTRASVHRRRGAGPYDVILLFAADTARLRRHFGPLAGALTTPGALWVCWPKLASGVRTDLRENSVREHGLSSGLVDVKVAAIDDTWSGLKFVRRRADR